MTGISPLEQLLVGGAAWMPALLDVAAKGIAIMSLTAIAVMAMRRSSAATRHLVWLLGTCSLLILPILCAVLPGWHILPQRTVSTAVQEQVTTDSTPSASMRSADERLLPAYAAPHDATSSSNAPVAHTPTDRNAWAWVWVWKRASLPWQGWFLLAWACGALVLMAHIALGYISLRWLEHRATRVMDNEWLALLLELRTQLGIRRPVDLLSSPRRTMPMTWGLWRTRLLLPEDASTWALDQRRTVLLHELAHAKRWDCLTQLLAQIACALYWFNPLVWLAWHRIQTERERACDDLVLLSTGTKASAYAEQLLYIASEMPAVGYSAAAIAMARPSKLEGRLLAVLDVTRNRRALTWSAATLAVLLIGAFAVPLSILRAADARKPELAGKNQPATGSAPAWGTPVDGVKMRLNAARTQWRADEIPSLTWDIRNDGPRQFLQVPGGQRMAQLEVDGVWYVWPPGLRGAMLPELGSGKSLDNQIITLSPIWQKAKSDELEWRQDGSWFNPGEKREVLQLSPGHHSVRVATIVEPSRVDTGGGVRVVSAPIEITVAPQPAVGKWPADAELTGSFDALAASVNQVFQDSLRADRARMAAVVRQALAAAQQIKPQAEETPLQPLIQSLATHLSSLLAAYEDQFPADTRELLDRIGRDSGQLLGTFTGDPTISPPATQQTGATPAIRLLSARTEGDRRVYTWSLADASSARLMHGWYIWDYERASGEHVGGGASNDAEALPRPVELDMEVWTEQGKLMMNMRRRWSKEDGRSASAKTATDIPAGAVFDTEALPEAMDFRLDGDCYLTLWRGQWKRDGRVVKTIRYVARVANANDPSEGFFVKDIKRVQLLAGDTMREPVMGMQPVPAIHPADADEPYRQLYTRYRDTILKPAQDGDSKQVEKLTDQLNEAIGGRLVHVVVHRLDPRDKLTLVLNKGFWSGRPARALPLISYDAGDAIHVTRMGDNVTVEKMMDGFLHIRLDLKPLPATQAGPSQAQMQAWVLKHLAIESCDMTVLRVLEWGQPEQRFRDAGWFSIRLRYTGFGFGWDGTFTSDRRYTFTTTGDFVRSDYTDGQGPGETKSSELPFKTPEEVIASLHRELVAMREYFPELADYPDQAPAGLELSYTHDFRDVGKGAFHYDDAYKDTGPHPLAIMLRLKPEKAVGEAERRQEQPTFLPNLHLFRWEGFHAGTNTTPRLKEKIGCLLSNHTAVLRQLDRPRAASQPTATHPVTIAPTPHGVARQAEQLVTAALSSRPVDENLLRAVLRHAVQVVVCYKAKGDPYFGGTFTTKVDPDATAVHLVRQQGGDAPPDWIEMLKAPLDKRPEVLVTLLLAVPEELRADRASALAQADEHLRAGLRQLVERFPFMTKARDWEKVSQAAARPDSSDRLSLWLSHSSGRGKGVTSDTPVLEAEKFGTLAILKPPQEEVEQLRMSPMFPCLGLEGQCGTEAGNAELATQLKTLLTESLAPIYELNERAARIIAGQLPDTSATRPAIPTAAGFVADPVAAIGKVLPEGMVVQGVSHDAYPSHWKEGKGLEISIGLTPQRLANTPHKQEETLIVWIMPADYQQSDPTLRPTSDDPHDLPQTNPAKKAATTPQGDLFLWGGGAEPELVRKVVQALLVQPTATQPANGTPWGQPEQGIQVRVQSTKAQWRVDEDVSITAGLNNDGAAFIVWDCMHGWVLELDGKPFPLMQTSHEWDGWRTIGKGQTIDEWDTLVLHRTEKGIQVRGSRHGSFYTAYTATDIVELAPGQHVIRLGFPLGSDQKPGEVPRFHQPAGEPGLVYSNRLVIEVLEFPATRPAAATYAGSKVDAARLEKATQHLKEVEQLQRAGMATALDYQRAKWEVKILEAEQSGDAVKLAQTRLDGASEIVKYLEALFRNGFVTYGELQDARAEVKLRQAELEAAGAATQPLRHPL